jgi:hypothetical protein
MAIDGADASGLELDEGEVTQMMRARWDTTGAD